MRHLKAPFAIALTIAAAVSGCDVWVPDPLTPDESEAQVVDAARDLVATLDLKVVEAVFWRSACNSDGDAPFRGELRISYPPAASFAESETQIAQMVGQLRNAGWSGDPGFHSHGSVLKKSNVEAVLGPQTASIPTRDILLYGECRDTTTNKETKGRVEPVSVS